MPKMSEPERVTTPPGGTFGSTSATPLLSTAKADTGLATCDPSGNGVLAHPLSGQEKYTFGAGLEAQTGQSWLNVPTPRMPLTPVSAPKLAPVLLHTAGTVA